MKLPYGISDFYTIMTQGFVYIDRTDKIPLLEETHSQLFIRPRRFGKSLLLSMLENYYDVSKKDEFNQLFGHLYIGKNPTQLRNSYYILKLNFSCIDATGTAAEIKHALYDHINGAIDAFQNYYVFKGFDLPEIKTNSENALSSINALASAVRLTPHPIYLMIDEYDNFANTIMMGVQSPEDHYEALVHEQGPLKTLFKVIKATTSATMFERVFITGVSPVVMSDITSGYNIAYNIYFEPEYNDLCGFRRCELLEQMVNTCGFQPDKISDAIDLMEVYYNGYMFSPDAEEPVYNPTLALYFLKKYLHACQYPKQMLDANLAVNDAKLAYIAQIPGGENLLMELMQTPQGKSIPEIQERFGIREMLSDQSYDRTFLASFLYYFGILTISGVTDSLKIILRIPNMVIKRLYVERLQINFLPHPLQRDEGREAAEQVYQKGDIGPLCMFMEKKYFKVFHNRDYRWANELTIKTAFLTLLYNDILFIMDSEKEIDRKHADLTMILRPDKRKARVFDILIEFKYVSLKKAGITSEQAQKMSQKELAHFPQIQSKLVNAEKQITEYCFASVGIGIFLKLC